MGRVHFLLEEISTEEIFRGRGVYFIEGESDLRALFEKRRENVPYMKSCPLLNTLLFTIKFECLSVLFNSG